MYMYMKFIDWYSFGLFFGLYWRWVYYYFCKENNGGFWSLVCVFGDKVKIVNIRYLCVMKYLVFWKVELELFLVVKFDSLRFNFLDVD